MSTAALAKRLARQLAAGVTSASGGTRRRMRSTEAASACPFHARWAADADKTGGRPVPKAAGGKPYSSIPAPRGLPLLGTALDVALAGGAPKIHEYCDRRHRELGPIYKETLGSVEAVFVADSALIQKVYASEGKFPMHMVPEAWLIYNEVKGIQRGLFFMDGPEWIERRRSLNNVFLKPKTVTDHVPVFNDVIADLLDRWQETRDHSGVLENLERELYNWSIESLGTMIFGRRLGCIASSSSMENVHEFVHCVQQIFNESAKMSMMSPRVAYKLGLPVWKRFVKAAGRALELARDYVEENVRNIASGTSAGQSHQGILSQLLLGERISEEELVRIVTDLFLAAADTTSHATQWAFYLLAKNPERQERLLEEVQSVVPHNQHVDEDCLARLPYVKAVIREALRLYPVAPFLTRILSEDIVLNGYTVPAGKLILMSLYTTGRDERQFTEPNEFRPERWLRDGDRASQSSNSWACLPFGLGARSCIGRRVAEVQMQSLIARTVQKFHLSPITDRDIPIKMRLITTPEEPVSLRLTPREGTV